MKQQYIIVGAGGFGRELACWIGLSEVLGFLDDTKGGYSMLPGYPDHPVLGRIDDWVQFQRHTFLIAIGDPEGREKVVERMQGAVLSIYVHRSAFIAENAEIGEGCIVGPFANIAANSVLGRFVIVNGHSGVGHDANVGEFTTLSSHVDITGHVTVGRKCFFGSRAGVIPGRKIGDSCLIGAGAIAISNVPASTTVYQNPPRFIWR